MCKEVDEWGIGLTCIRSKCDSLLLKQLLRMLEDRNTKQHNHMNFWLGHFPLKKKYEGRKVETRCAALEYPHVPRVGKESGDGAPLAQEIRLSWHYSRLLEELSYTHRNQYFELFGTDEIKAVTAKQHIKRTPQLLLLQPSSSKETCRTGAWCGKGWGPSCSSPGPGRSCTFIFIYFISQKSDEQYCVYYGGA